MQVNDNPKLEHILQHISFADEIGRTMEPAGAQSVYPVSYTKTTKNYQERLALLLHARECTRRENGACKMRYCATSKDDFTHMTVCKLGCSRPNCRSLLQLFGHWIECGRGYCLICQPIVANLCMKASKRKQEASGLLARNEPSTTQQPEKVHEIPQKLNEKRTPNEQQQAESHQDESSPKKVKIKRQEIKQEPQDEPQIEIPVDSTGLWQQSMNFIRHAFCCYMKNIES
jgi:hypothetical protein